MELFPKFSELDSLFPIELMLISQIISFMYVICNKRKVLSMDLKDNVLVPTDLKKNWAILPRSCDEEYLISLALKHRLSGKSVLTSNKLTLLKSILHFKN